MSDMDEVSEVTPTMMDVEWKAWRNIIKEVELIFPEFDLESQGATRVFDAIRLWGEELSNLRAYQSEDISEKARIDAQLKYSRYR